MQTARGLPAERFVSKRDAWLVAVLWAASLLDFLIAAWLWRGRGGAPAFVAPLLGLTGAFQLHVLYATDYLLADEELRIRASLFRWRVPLAAIDAVEPTRSPLSSPACSLDRLRIRYRGRQVLVSPLDKPGFLRALASRARQLEPSGGGMRRRPG